MKSKTINIMMLIFSAALSIGVMTVFRACAAKDDGTWMNCHHAQMGVFCLGLVWFVLYVIKLFIKKNIMNIVLDVCGVIAGVIAMLIPNTIVKMCMMNNMRCRSVMTPFVLVMSVLLIVMSIIDIVLIASKHQR